MPEPSDQYVQSLARGLSVIAAFGANLPEATLTEIADATGLTRATARRVLHTLVELGYARHDRGRFALTPLVLRLGTAYLSGLGLPEVAQPHLERLSARVGESTSAAILDGGDIVYVARVATRRIMSVGITVGTRFPAYATSMGRVLLAALPSSDLEEYLGATKLAALTERTVVDRAALRDLLSAVDRQGYASNDQELAAGLRSIAAPVRDRSGAVVAAINVSSTVGHEPVAEFLHPLLETAEAITADLSQLR